MSSWVPSASGLFVSCIPALVKTTLVPSCTVYWLNVVAVGAIHHPDGTDVPEKLVAKTSGSSGPKGKRLGACLDAQLPSDDVPARAIDASRTTMLRTDASRQPDTTRRVVRVVTRSPARTRPTLPRRTAARRGNGAAAA
jgi:hypothetical protein